MTQKPCNDVEYLPIADFYAGKSVFVTGATGFLGKAYVEKLAYSCPQIENIYILIRDKKGLRIEQRIEKYLDQYIFTRIRKERPEALNKIVPIYGDITAPNLGIKPEDEQYLLEKVSIVIHSAATIKFNEPLKLALNINVEGTRKVLNFAKRMKNIQAFIYISTAYSNTDQKVLEEVMYPPPAELSDVQKFSEEHYILGGDENEIKKLLKFHPNTYTFTKALAETLVAKNHGDVPTIIIRPSIISASAKEPFEGWVDTWGGATNFFTFIVKGWNHVLLSQRNVILDIIPLDHVTNFMLVAAAKYKRSEDVTVYNCCTSGTNPITMGELYKLLKQYNLDNRISDKGCSVFVLLTQSRSLVSIYTFLTQIAPAFAADLSLRCTGKQPKFVKLQSLVTKVCEAFEYFTSHSWEMRCDRARALANSLSSRDRELFPCDPANIEWTQYINNHITGITKYLLKNKF